MQEIILRLLELSKASNNFSSPPDEVWSSDESAQYLLGGIGLPIESLPVESARKNVWLSRSAVPFNIEQAASQVLYQRVAPFIEEMIEVAYTSTKDFTEVSAKWLFENAYLLPIVMHASGTFSKQELNKIIGSVSDTGISKPASERLSLLFKDLDGSTIPSRSRVRERMRATTEGIVRDLVGRLLLEDFVASSLESAGVPFKRESEYSALAGVVYSFRADFVIPDEVQPKAFIEVRKSSSRHASLYAKDKMFSAINWKGQHPRCLGIIVVDGPWSEASLNVMAKVFDYVVPIGRAAQVAEMIRGYLDGDDSVLRWLIQFSIRENSLVSISNSGRL